MKRALAGTAIALLAARLLFTHIIPGWNEIQTDFPNYYTSAWAVRNAHPLHDLYDPYWFDKENSRAGIHGQAALFNYYTPFSALVMWPIAGLPPLEAKRIWLGVNLLTLFVLISILQKASGLSKSAAVFIALLGGDALGNNLAFGQFYILLTLLLTVTVIYSDTRPVVAGLCLAAAIVVKVFPVLFLLYLALTRRWKAVVWTMAGLALATALGIALVGWVPHRVFTAEVLPRMLHGEVQDPYNIRWNTLQALLRRALVFEPGLNPNPLVNEPGLYFFLRTFISAGITLITFAALFRHPRNSMLAYGMLVAAISLITPSQASYHHVLFIPAAAGAIHAVSGIRMQTVFAIALALVCSDYMGLGIRWDSGWRMFLAFPRAYLVFGFWLFSLVFFMRGRPHKAKAVTVAVAVGALCGAIALRVELDRWKHDETDKAEMVLAQSGGLMEIYPQVNSNGLSYLSLKGQGFAAVGPDRSQQEPMETVASPDGKSVASAEWANGRYRIVEWDAEKKQRRLILEGQADYRYPAYSPDGQWLAFSTNASGNWDIARHSLHGGTIERLTTSLADDYMPAYSTDGREIYFASDRRRGYRFTAIFKMPIEP